MKGFLLCIIRVYAEIHHQYVFNNDNSTTVFDSGSGTAINGTTTGTTLIAGYDGAGSARHFDGNSYIAFSDKVIPTGKVSVSFKIRKSSSSDIVVGTGQYFFGNVNNYVTDIGMTGYILSDGKLAIEICHTGQVFGISSTSTICDNNWHDILFTWDGTTNQNAAKLYVDDMTTPNKTKTASLRKLIQHHLHIIYTLEV